MAKFLTHFQRGNDNMHPLTDVLGMVTAKNIVNR